MIDITMKIPKEHDVWNWVKNNENKLIALGHIGTHIDVYKKSNVPLEYFKTKGIIVDCTKYRLDDEIGIEVIKDITIEKGNFVIFKTDIQREHSYGSDTYVKSHHQLSWELINKLLEKKVAFIGIDGPGVRRAEEHFKADVESELNETYVIENLDLSEMSIKNIEMCNIYTMWIENPFATGLATRVLVDL